MKIMIDEKPPILISTEYKYTSETHKYKLKYGTYECGYCGSIFTANYSEVTTGRIKSCGCYRRYKTSLMATHGLSQHKFYGTWRQMVQRCNNPKHKNYSNYGARGIKVCEEWLNVKNFINWVESTHPNQEGYTLDRINNDKGYSPENCRWADKTIQAINQRIGKNNTSGYVGITSNGANWMARIMVNNKRVCLGTFPTKEEAVQVRDNYIIDNELPNKLSTEY